VNPGVGNFQFPQLGKFGFPLTLEIIRGDLVNPKAVERAVGGVASYPIARYAPSSSQVSRVGSGRVLGADKQSLPEGQGRASWKAFLGARAKLAAAREDVNRNVSIPSSMNAPAGAWVPVSVAA
jgi:hypothetical protein